MKISIVTVAFNSAATIRDTFDSVLSQTYHDIEYIVVDGVSKDNTVAIIKEYESKFEGRMRWVSEPDKGLYDAMNKGIRMATGDVVGIINSDDLYENEQVIAQVAEAFQKEDVDCVYGNLKFVKEHDITKVVRTWKGKPHVKGAFLKGWHPAHPTFYCRREHFERLGGFDTTLPIAADFELMMRFIEKNKLKNHYVDCCFVKMRMGGESTRSFKNICQGRKQIRRAFEKNGYTLPFGYFFCRYLHKLANMARVKLGLKK